MNHVWEADHSDDTQCRVNNFYTIFKEHRPNNAGEFFIYDISDISLHMYVYTYDYYYLKMISAIQ